MNLTKNQETEIMQVYDTWLHSYLNGDVQTYDSFFDDRYHFIGSTNNEEFLNRKETTNFFRETADQLSGKTDLRNEKRILEKFGELIILTHVFDAWFLQANDWTYYGRFRCTSALQEKKEGWRFIYQHFSTTDSKTDVGETIGFDKVSAENNELREAIKRRTVELEIKNRELLIESALERIRSHVTAMKKSSDLLDIVVTMRDEFTKLGHRADYFWHMTWLPDKFKKAMTSGDGSKIGMIMELPRDFHSHYKGMDEWEANDEPCMILALEVDEALDYLHKMVTLGDFKLVDPNAPTEDDIRHIGGITFVMARTSHGEIGYSLPGVVKNPPEEDLMILERFAGVFDLAHRRFFDLQKSEKQAREVQIELGLEKVRSRAMAMQNSSELSDLVDTVFKELAILDFALQACIINLIDIENLCNTVWMKSPDVGNIPDSYIMKFEDYPFHDAMKDGYLKREVKFIYTIQGAEKKKYDKYLFTDTEFRKISQKAQDSFTSLEKYVCSFTFSNFGGIQTIGQEPLSDENLDILARFGKVFDLTYTRFNDLKLAEAQARESGIELALERVRARTMAMQESEELGDVATVLFKELNQLVDNLWTCGFVLCEKDRKEDEWWLSTEEGFIPPLFLPNVGDDTHHNIYEAWKNGASYHTEQLEGEALQEHYDWLMTIPAAKETFDDMQASGQKRPSWQKLHCAYFSYGYLVMITEIPCPEEEIFKRFAKVFDQTYTRFLDLQKSEKQGREAEIELALERVRARTMAMQNSEELKEVIQVIFDQLGLLNINAEHAGIVVDYKAKEDWHFWVAETQDIPSRITVPYLDSAWDRQFTEAKKKGKDFFTTHLNFKEKNKFYEKMLPYIKGLTKKARNFYLTCPGLSISTAIQNDIGLYIENFSGQPYSKEENSVLIRFGKVFQQTYTRFLDLQKAEAQTKEVQIEAALERVRSKTMAMHSSSDVEDTVKTFFDEVLKLGIDNSIRCGIGILEGYEGMETWSAKATDEGGVEMRVGMLNMNIHPMLRGLKKAWKNGEKGYSYYYTQKDVLKYYKALNNEPEYPFNADLNNLPKKEYHNSFFFSSGIIFAFTENPLTEESLAVLHRFAEVFGQTYRRFLDLQKVEAQSREAQIELALERVRNRAMTMMKSDELGDLIITVFKELQGLDMELTRCLLWIFNKEDESAVTWMTNSEDPDCADHYHVPFHNHPAYISYIKGWKAELPEWEYHLKGKNKDDWDEILVEGFFKKLPRKVKNAMKAPERVILSGSFNKYGLIQTAGLDPLSNENKGIVKRFSQVFEQNYNRFLDLKKAEKQAREAQIEAALEKVRSRTMAMQLSDELQEAANLLFLEVQGLGINAWSAGYNIVNKEKTQSVCWMSSEGELQAPFPLYFSKETSFKAMGKFLKSDETFYVQELKGKALVKHYDYMKSLPELKETFQHLVDAGLSLPTYQINHLCKFSRGFLLFITYEQVPEAHIIFQRFTKIFEQTYTRFQDLQKAENQAKETIKNASVDRIRAEIASMRTSTDLQRITPLVWTELTTLNVPFIRCGVFIMDEEKQQVQTHLSTPDGKAIASFDLPFENTKPLDQLLPYWRKKEMYTDFWDEKAFIESSKILMQRGAITSSENYITENQPTSLHLYFFPFLQGMLYVGSEVTLTDDELNLAQNLAEAFSSAYARYEDFNKLELANKKIEKTLTDLKQTQAQLVQSEKMASLGELTAGIAHEIQNPLNFVNNFSEVSHELLIELKEELDKGDLEEVLEITNDIEQNLEKINHHGQRASDIVKGMLQHSRSSSGAKELTDINALADEFLRLAYHGLRAKDKTFNAKLVTEFDESLDKINIVPQDIGRVILNLITNAFHTVSEKKKATSEPYDPTVTVSTKKLKDSIEIKVADNGNGIPKKVLNKIFQPFFTTKPTGQGTGLGLSLSYDIVKAHGGELKVETKENKGTEFSIILSLSKIN